MLSLKLKKFQPSSSRRERLAAGLGVKGRPSLRAERVKKGLRRETQAEGRQERPRTTPPERRELLLTLVKIIEKNDSKQLDQH